MGKALKDLNAMGIAVRNAVGKVPPPKGDGRPPTKKIYEALKGLKALRQALEQQFQGPVKCRYAGCPPVIRSAGKHQRVLGYLWDFSFSRFGIPQAIEQDGRISGQYEMLFVAESELGTADEVCRDLLKLLDGRSKIRCLIFKQPKTVKHRAELHSRMIRVLHNHAHFDASIDQWLFIGLSWGSQQMSAVGYTLAEDGSALMPLIEG